MQPRALKFLALTVLTLVPTLAACGTSGDNGASDTTTTVADTTTTVTDPSSTTTTTTVTDTTTDTTDTTDAGRLPPCQELLQQYADTFTPDDLDPVIDLFRSWVPFMPDDVALATGNLADAYEQAGGSVANLNMADVELTADAQTFSDWTNNGCPPK